MWLAFPIRAQTLFRTGITIRKLLIKRRTHVRAVFVHPLTGPRERATELWTIAQLRVPPGREEHLGLALRVPTGLLIGRRTPTHFMFALRRTLGSRITRLIRIHIRLRRRQALPQT